MRQGLLPYTIEVVSARDTLTARAGLPLVVEQMRALGLDRVIAEHVRVRTRASGYPEAAKVEALVLLLASGGECVDDLAVLKADTGLSRLLGRPLPSADALWTFLQAFHDDALLTAAQAARGPDQVAYIPAESAPLRGLAAVNTACVRGVAARGEGHGGDPGPRRHALGEPQARGPAALPRRARLPASGDLLGGAGPRGRR